MTSRLAIPTGTPGTRPGSPEELRRYDLLLAGFDLLDQAIAVFDATPKLVTWNKALLRLLDFPEDMVRVGTPFEAFVRFKALADVKKTVYDEDIEALVDDEIVHAQERVKVMSLTVIAGTRGPQRATMKLLS